jgi:hypothetical protein
MQNASQNTNLLQFSQTSINANGPIGCQQAKKFFPAFLPSPSQFKLPSNFHPTACQVFFLSAIPSSFKMVKVSFGLTDASSPPTTIDNTGSSAVTDR